MSEVQFVQEMVELMDTEATIGMETVLAELEEWDSLSKVAFMAMAAGASEKKVSYEDVKKATTIRELYNLI